MKNIHTCKLFIIIKKYNIFYLDINIYLYWHTSSLFIIYSIFLLYTSIIWEEYRNKSIYSLFVVYRKIAAET